MADAQPPVDWTTISAGSRGSRHYEGPTLGEVTAWVCPGCGAENQSVLEQGCPRCGAGKPGRRLTDEEIAAQQPKPRAQTTATPTYSTVFSGFAGTQAYAAFDAWVAPQRNDYTNEQFAFLRKGFLAGYQAGHGVLVEPARSLAGTAESRTVVAALRFFIEQVLRDAEDEIASGEYLSVPDVEALIARLERTDG